MNLERIKKKLFNGFKLSGFNIRKEFCELIIEKCIEEHIDLTDTEIFDGCIKDICQSLERQNIHDRSIELEHIKQAIEVCLHSGHDKHETVFKVIGAFEFPRLRYDPERKRYMVSSKKSTFLSDANSKAQLFLERYESILQRTRRNFKNKLTTEANRIQLQTVDYLLTLSEHTLDKTVILGSLLQVSEGKYYLEDPTGIVHLDLTHAKFHGGLFVENCFVLVNGYYEDKKLMVSTIILPPGEEYNDSKLSFSNINYFGGDSSTPLRQSQALKDYLNRNPMNMLLLFSDVWLDHPNVFEKLEMLFNGMEANPPSAFIFMGNFMSESHGSEYIEVLSKLFKQFASLVNQFPNILNNSKFVFVPGMMDPCTPHIVPRISLPSIISSQFTKVVPNAIFTTNPCRIQYCTREIVLFRADVLAKLMQATIHKPQKDELSDCVTRTVISQGHLSPMSLNALTVHWDFDYTLNLYPLPNLIVIGDKSESYQGEYKGCKVVNPGSFCEGGFQFKCYTPYTEQLDDCVL
ncbi:PREDICTED: DNA polymerase epsilon subunit 2 [Nicrophorus vespilloides]|uniref:DNA polymerase epsilon subunit n=1 Tax=Nicrophorus vespilloides TaxID=110193 RepID=A0ABM1M3T3_NICVS|nr:PREDICTED: DNA polymerase epsilon subunit 2 [Nicrophorus vespilloides]